KESLGIRITSVFRPLPRQSYRSLTVLCCYLFAKRESPWRIRKQIQCCNVFTKRTFTVCVQHQLVSLVNDDTGVGFELCTPGDLTLGQTGKLPRSGRLGEGCSAA